MVEIIINYLCLAFLISQPLCRWHIIFLLGNEGANFCKNNPSNRSIGSEKEILFCNVLCAIFVNGGKWWIVYNLFICVHGHHTRFIGNVSKIGSLGSFSPIIGERGVGIVDRYKLRRKNLSLCGLEGILKR